MASIGWPLFDLCGCQAEVGDMTKMSEATVYLFVM